MKNKLIFGVAVVSILAVPPAHAAPAPVRIIDARGTAVSDIVLVKGRSLMLAAESSSHDGGAPTQVTWSSQPEGIVELKAEGGGRVRVTALHDWFDEKPGKEPTAVIVACIGSICTSVLATCLPDVAGTWPTKLVVGGLFGGSEIRNLVFVQNGRFVTFDPEPANRPDPDRIATLRLDGNVLRLVKRGNVLTRFDGTLEDRVTGKGNWSSSWGFSGTWTANKNR